MRVDMHLHTRHSFDCLSEPEAVLERALACRIDVICVTDHNELDGALELQASHPEHVIAGEEVKTEEEIDIIGLFLRERIPAGTPALETCRLIREQGGIVYVPHPFADGKGGGDRILSAIQGSIDVVEGFNARIHDPTLNVRAVNWARRRGLPVGAGTDAHTLAEIGRAYTDMPRCELAPEPFLAALKAAELRGRPASRVVHVASTLAKIRKRIGVG